MRSLPATADLLAKLAHGLADDFLTTLYLAFTGTVVIAPAMNVNMWLHPATQANLETLRARGHRIVEPESGYLACGMTGPGRLADPETIAAAIAREAPRPRDLEGETVLITAGPTQEPLDPRPLHLEPFEREDGLRAGRSRRRPRRARGPDLRSGAPRPAARRGNHLRADGAGDARSRLCPPGAGPEL